MIVKKQSEFRYSDITPKEVYLNRRRFLKGAAIAGAAAISGKGIFDLISPGTTVFAGTKFGNLAKSPFSTTEKPNSFSDVSTYNNFYEFGTGKDEPAVKAKNFKTDPWVVTVDGLVGKPQKFSMDDILKIAPLEERIYRHRCVEAWSIVVPWVGYSLSEILKKAEPDPKAKYVAFESFFDVKQMPMSRNAGIDFPYREGLRLDEAMHPLALLSVGMYGETLPPQNGAPLRMVLPWKYGFKSIKSIIRIKLVDRQPPNTWNLSAPNEYGFYSNVNPAVDHPRWSQAKERRLGEFLRRTTLPFNGYGDQVAGLYKGMDLRKNF